MKSVVQAVDTLDPIWRLEEIAEYLKLPSIKSAYSIINQPGFPRSIMPGKRNRRWIASEIKEFFRDHKAVNQGTRAIQKTSGQSEIFRRKTRLRSS